MNMNNDFLKQKFLSENFLILQIRPGFGQKFACPFCPRVFRSSKRDLDVHIRSHTGEKPYACPHCTYACSHKSNLTKHISSQHVPKYL